MVGRWNGINFVPMIYHLNKNKVVKGISKLKSTQSQVINNSSNLKGILNPGHLLGKVLGFHVFPGKEILLI